MPPSATRSAPILGGGLAPIIATDALYASFDTSLAITGYFVLIALISLASILVLKVPGPTSSRPIEQEAVSSMSTYYQPKKYPARTSRR